MITAHLSEKKTLGDQKNLPTNFSSELKIDGKIVQEVTEDRQSVLSIRGYPYPDIIATTDKESENTQTITNYFSGLVGETVIREKTSFDKNEGTHKIKKDIKTTPYLTAETVITQRQNKEETVIGTSYSKGSDYLGDEETQVTNNKIEHKDLDKYIEKLCTFIDPKDEDTNTFFKTVIERLEQPDEIYVKQVIKHRNMDPSLKTFLENSEFAPLYPSETDTEFSRKYAVLELGYTDKEKNTWLKAIILGPRKETEESSRQTEDTDTPIISNQTEETEESSRQTENADNSYIIIKEKINVKDGIESVEKDFFIDSDKTSVLKHLG